MAQDFDWLSLEAVEAAIPAMEATGTSEVARGVKPSSQTKMGFIEAYRLAKGKPTKMAKMQATTNKTWADRRHQFISRHLAQMRSSDTHRSGFRPDGTPTKRMLGLIAWAYIPPESRKRAKRWYAEGCPVQVTKRRNEQASLFSEKMLGIPVMHFASGSNHPAEIRGFARLRKPVGVAASAIRFLDKKRKIPTPEGPKKSRTEETWEYLQRGGRVAWADLCKADCERELIAAARQGVPVFIDSGAFSEIEFGPQGPYDVLPIDHDEWLKRLALYERVIDGVGPENARLVNVVAPDKIADQGETLRRLRTYAPIVNRLRQKGASILVPVQKGSRSMAQFHDDINRALGFRDWVVTVPMKKDATTPAELRDYLRARKPRRVHLLGVGPSSRKTTEIAQAIREGHPQAQVQGDSVLIRAVVGRQSGVKPLTAAQDVMRLEAQEFRATGAYPSSYRTGEGFGLSDYTDALDDLDWLTTSDRRAIARALQMDRASARQWTADPTEASQAGYTVVGDKIRLVDDDDAPRLYDHPAYDSAVFGVWSKQQKTQEVGPVKELAIERVFRERGAGPMAIYRNPRDRRREELKRAQVLPVGPVAASLARRLAEYPAGRAHRIGLRSEAGAVPTLRRMGWVKVVDTLPPEPGGPAWTIYDVLPTKKLYAAVERTQRAREQYREEFEQQSLFGAVRRRNDAQSAMFGKLPENPFAAKMTQRKRESGQDWFDVLAPLGAPKTKKQGYRRPPTAPRGAWGSGDPYQAAKDLLDGAERMYEQPEARELYFRDPSDPGMTMDIESEFRDIDDFIEYVEDRNENLNFYMDVMNVPDRDGSGNPLELKERLAIARRALDYVTLMRGGIIGEYGSGYTIIDPGKSRKGTAKPKHARKDEEGRLPKWAAQAIFGDLLASMTPGYGMKLRLVNVDKDTARQFIEKHHSALPYLNPRGLMYALGVMKGNRLVAVATASTPSAKWAPRPTSWADYRAGRERWVDPRNVMELTRVASDGSTKGAASKLVARLLTLLPQSKRGDPDLPALFVTYQLTSEDGSSYKALQDRGLRPVAFREGKEPSGSRAGATEDKALARVDKIRWEYSPDPNTALPARWDLIDPKLQRRKRRAKAKAKRAQVKIAGNPRSAWDARNRPGSKVQSIIFDAGKWTLGEAKAWLRKHRFTGLVADRKANTIRFRQLDPGAFRRGSFRTIPFDVETGIQAVVGVPQR